ncbi:MAG: hypothetical protein K0R43_1071 [Pseudoduganella sp.]|jgi:hypothetical protein|nr:hypothetical protein [Pseudoduganella sp.]
MAELEVAKHGKNVVDLVASKEHGLGHKLREIALEIAIIVFAVSISIWFHGMSEHRHEQAQVKAFLLGLKSDLARDVEDLGFVVQAYREADATYQYLAALDPKAAPDEQFEKQFARADVNRYFVPVTSRFEGFKSGGKLTNIEDEALLNDILTLYQYAHPAIRRSEGAWGGNQEKMRAYLDNALEQDDSRDQAYRAVTAAPGKRRLRKMVAYPQLYERYATAIALSKKISDRIDVLYKAS